MGDSTIARAVRAGAAFTTFTSIQGAPHVAPGEVHAAKVGLAEGLAALRTDLNRALAVRYGVNVDDVPALRSWELKHQPFHWVTEFYPVMAKGGFDVVVGNPPYIESTKVREKYTLLPEFDPYRTNLYAAFAFRATQIKHEGAYLSFIVPVSLPSTDRMEPVRKLLLDGHDVCHVSFSTRPSKLFDAPNSDLLSLRNFRAMVVDRVLRQGAIGSGIRRRGLAYSHRCNTLRPVRCTSATASGRNLVMRNR